MRIFQTSVDIRGKNVFFSKFCVVDAALHNGNILGCNNRTVTVDTALKSVDDEFVEKLNVQGPFEYSTSPEST